MRATFLPILGCLAFVLTATSTLSIADLTGTVFAFVSTPTPIATDYHLVASDGGIFALGTAGFFGSTGATALNKPIVGMASS